MSAHRRSPAVIRSINYLTLIDDRADFVEREHFSPTQTLNRFCTQLVWFHPRKSGAIAVRQSHRWPRSQRRRRRMLLKAVARPDYAGLAASDGQTSLRACANRVLMTKLREVRARRLDIERTLKKLRSPFRQSSPSGAVKRRNEKRLIYSRAR